MRKEGDCLEKETMQGNVPVTRETKDAMDWQYGKMGWNVIWQTTEGDRKQKEME